MCCFRGGVKNEFFDFVLNKGGGLPPKLSKLQKPVFGLKKPTFSARGDFLSPGCIKWENFLRFQ